MKILILYTARSGSNSIAKYFMAQNLNFIYFNQPWSFYNKEGIKRVSYEECISHKNVLVKCEILSLKNAGVDDKIVINDFDKVVLLSRKNKNEQATSYIIAKSQGKFIDSSKKKYYVNGIDSNVIKKTENQLSEKEDILKNYQNSKSRLFYYEDLFYNSFNELFLFLNLKYIQQDYDLYLNVSNRYKEEELKSKSEFSII